MEDRMDQWTVNVDWELAEQTSPKFVSGEKSSLSLVTSDTSPPVDLEPMLVNIFISDLDDRTLSVFADDTKLGEEAGTAECCASI